MSTLNQIQNNYITLSISTTNHSIKTIVIQNPWRLNLHCGDQINWTFETTEKKKNTNSKIEREKKNRQVQLPKDFESKLTRKLDEIPTIKNHISFDWPIRSETSTAEVYFEIVRWIVRVCANCKCFNFWHKCSLWVKVAIFQLRRNSM